jgi:hypothetical protein
VQNIVLFICLDPRGRKWQEVGEDCIMKSFITSMLHGILFKSRRVRWMGHVGHVGEMINAYNILVGKPKGKRPLRRPRHRWEDNIRMDLREIGLEGVDWIHLAQDRNQWWALVNMVMSLQVP